MQARVPRARPARYVDLSPGGGKETRLDGAWHRQDPRGNKPGVDAQFSLSQERLAWPVFPALGECDYPQVFVRPHPAVVAVLTEATNMLDLCRVGLPTGL